MPKMDPKKVRAPGKHAVKTRIADGRNYTIKLQVFWQAKLHYKTALKVPKVIPNGPKMIPEDRNSEPHSYHSKGKKNTSFPPQGEALLSTTWVKLGHLVIKTPHVHAVRRTFCDGQKCTIKITFFWQAFKHNTTAQKVSTVTLKCSKWFSQCRPVATCNR